MNNYVRRRFTDDFKSQAVALSEELGRTEAARQLDMSVKTSNNWIGLSRAGKPFSSLDRKPVSEPDSEMTRLRAENARLRMERDILKKATAFFAKESK